jgi:hypothetical protein
MTIKHRSDPPTRKNRGKSATVPARVDEIPANWFDEVRQRAENQSGIHCIERSDPAKAAAILWRVAQGVSLKKISDDLDVNRTVIRRLCWRHSDTLEVKKKEFSREFAMAAEAYKDLLLEKADRLFDNPEKLDDISPDKLALAMAIATDKSMALAGMASTVVEFRKGASLDDAATMIAEARARIAERARETALEAEIVET